MKLHTLFYGACFSFLAIATVSCTDQIKFGNAFLEKAPGGDVTGDTIFNNPEYTKRFLAGCYSRQYYGLTFGTGFANSVSGWTGKFDALTDCYQLYYSDTKVNNNYYLMQLDANQTGVFGFANEFVWETIRSCLELLERVDGVPGLSDTEKNRMKAETYCIMASRYFDAFQFYGGLPILQNRFSGTESSYNVPRETAEKTVEYIVSLLDKAINTSELPWAYSGDEAETETGHWTKAGAMALKCRVYQFAASPLFNSDQGYYGGTTEAEKQHLVWYGAYKPEYWTKLKTACEDFFSALNANGHYKLLEPKDLNSSWTKPTAQQYRLAYRRGYIWEGSPEILHSVRVAAKTNTKYNWFSWVKNGRNSYCPTQEYINLFPWSDGTPFNWDETEKEGKLDEMFVKGSIKNHALTNIELTRDPRLYETAFVNGVQARLGWADAKTSGNSFETWEGGANAGTAPSKETGKFATGYYSVKFTLNPNGDGKGDDNGLYIQWPTLRLADIYLMYAEALIQADRNCTGALEYINKVRARVGLPNLEDCDHRYNYTSDTSALLEELLNERAREFGMENIRFFDLIRYKRTDIFSKQLHRLVMHRQIQKNGKWEDYDMKWYGNDNKKVDFPTHYRYEVLPIGAPARLWWTNGFDNKWLLAPIPTTEINKNYGLIQNPGW